MANPPGRFGIGDHLGIRNRHIDMLGFGFDWDGLGYFNLVGNKAADQYLHIQDDEGVIFIGHDDVVNSGKISLAVFVNRNDSLMNKMVITEAQTFEVHASYDATALGGSKPYIELEVDNGTYGLYRYISQITFSSTSAITRLYDEYVPDNTQPSKNIQNNLQYLSGSQNIRFGIESNTLTGALSSSAMILIDTSYGITLDNDFGVNLPARTTAQINANANPVVGKVILDSSLSRLKVYVSNSDGFGTPGYITLAKQ